MYKTVSYTIVLSPDKVYSASLALADLPDNDRFCVFSATISAPNAFRMDITDSDSNVNYRIISSGYVEESLTKPLSQLKQYSLYLKSDVLMSCQITLTYEQPELEPPESPAEEQNGGFVIGVVIVVCLISLVGLVAIVYLNLK
jgi:hypothetical protein